MKRPTRFEWIFLAVLIGVTYSVLYPIWKSARPAAPRTVCLSNLKQLALAALMYSNDADDRFPPADRWMDVVESYRTHEDVSHDVEGVPLRGFGYAFRERLWSVDASELQNSNRLALIFDSDLTDRNAHSELWSIPQVGRHASSDGRVDNIAFADGHARGFLTQSSGRPARSPLQEMMEDNDRLIRRER
ncbi:MAG: DUF1559 domain-containing protein [Fimbriimonas sp.]|nr:DUF1559 domain-containing protein [Fimbriimonas sp.]